MQILLLNRYLKVFHLVTGTCLIALLPIVHRYAACGNFEAICLTNKPTQAIYGIDAQWDEVALLTNLVLTDRLVTFLP